MINLFTDKASLMSVDNIVLVHYLSCCGKFHFWLVKSIVLYNEINLQTPIV